MKYLVIQNKGILPINGIMLMGGTSKRGKTDKIGNYGSGLKYAIVALLNFKIPFKIFRGSEEVIVELRQEQLADTTVDVVYIDGKCTNFTTLMGPDWELWMAIREIYCNAVDEGVFTVETVIQESFDSFKPVDTATTFIIQCTPEIDSILDNWEQYFSIYRTPLVTKEGEYRIYPRLYSDKSIIYRKGICVAVSKDPGCFDYDFEDLPINELRVVKDFYYVIQALKDAMISNFDGDILKKILNSQNTWEKQLSLHSFDNIRNADAWSYAIADRMIVPAEFANEATRSKKDVLILPLSFCEGISTSLPEHLIAGYENGKIAIMMEASQEQLEAAIKGDDIVRQIAYSHHSEIQFCDFKNRSVRSRLKDTIIQISHLLTSEHDIVYEIFKQNYIMKFELQKRLDDLKDHALANLFNSLQTI